MEKNCVLRRYNEYGTLHTMLQLLPKECYQWESVGIFVRALGFSICSFVFEGRFRGSVSLQIFAMYQKRKWTSFFER